MENSKEDKQNELEQAAIDYSKKHGRNTYSFYNNELDLENAFLDGANWQSNQQTPTPSTIEQGQDESVQSVSPVIDERWVALIKKAHWHGWLVRERYTGPDRHGYENVLPKNWIDMDYDEHEEWFSEQFIKKNLPPQSFDEQKAEQGQQGDEPKRGCGICGGSLLLIRGRYPKDDKRLVCPTCNTERLEQINEISSKTYGVAMKESSLPKPPIK